VYWLDTEVAKMESFDDELLHKSLYKLQKLQEKQHMTQHTVGKIINLLDRTIKNTIELNQKHTKTNKLVKCL